MWFFPHAKMLVHRHMELIILSHNVCRAFKNDGNGYAVIYRYLLKDGCFLLSMKGK